MGRMGRWSQGHRRTAPAGRDPAIVARIVRIAATHGPFRTECLPRAVVLWTLLQRDGFDAEVKLGVRQGPRGFEAHAWVELEGVALGQAVEPVPFVPLRAAVTGR